MVLNATKIEKVTTAIEQIQKYLNKTKGKTEGVYTMSVIKSPSENKYSALAILRHLANKAEEQSGVEHRA